MRTDSALGSVSRAMAASRFACLYNAEQAYRSPALHGVMVWGRMLSKTHFKNLMLVALVLEDASAIG